MSQNTERLKERVTGQLQQHPLEKLRLQMIQNKSSIATLIGAQHVDKFIQVALNACAQNHDLIDAYRPSLFIACRKCAMDGLFPDGKEAALVIYKTKIKLPGGRETYVPAVQYLPMVRGLFKLLWSTGLFSKIDAVAVYERDHFVYTRGDHPGIEHKPFTGDEDPGPVVAAYFIAEFKDGGTHREVMFRRDIERARKSSKNPSAGPWVDWPDQMAIKTVVHRAFKQLPGLPDKVEQAIERAVIDTEADIGDLIQIPEGLGGEPVPAGASAVGANQADPDTLATQAETVGAKTANRASKAPNDPGPSQGLPMTMIDAKAAVGRGEYDVARDLARSIGGEAALMEIDELIADEKAGNP